MVVRERFGGRMFVFSNLEEVFLFLKFVTGPKGEEHVPNKPYTWGPPLIPSIFPCFAKTVGYYLTLCIAFSLCRRYFSLFLR